MLTKRELFTELKNEIVKIKKANFGDKFKEAK